ncbi:MAG: hypothetical protein ACLVKJ_06845 [Acutalibacteraceae bacterium]
MSAGHTTAAVGRAMAYEKERISYEYPELPTMTFCAIWKSI